MGLNLTSGVVITFIIGLVVLIILGGFFSDKILAMTNPLFGEDTEKDQQEIISDTENIFNQFMNEYKACKETPDTSCFCPITHFALPNSYALKLTNSGGITSFTLQREDRIEVKDPGKITPSPVNNDRMLAPLKTPGWTGSFLDNKGSLDSSLFHISNEITLYYRNPGMTEDLATSIGIKSGTSDDLSLYGFYKASQIDTYFVPTPHSYGPDSTELCLKKQIDSLRKCSRMDPKTKPSVDESLEKIKVAIANCKGTSSSEPRMCGIKVPMIVPEGYTWIFEGTNIMLKSPTAEGMYIESYPIELEAGTFQRSIRYMFTNNKWTWKSEAGLIGTCSCNYYSTDLSKVECDYDAIDSPLTPSDQNLVNKLNQAQTSYEQGLKIIMQHTIINNQDLTIQTSPGRIFHPGDMNARMQGQAFEEFKKLATKSKTETNGIVRKVDLGVNICQLKTYNPIVPLSTTNPIISDSWVEFADIGDNMLCFYAYTPSEMESLVRQAEYQKLFT